MTKILNYLAICILLSFSTCTFQDHVDPGVDKAKVIEALTAENRFWKIESMIKEVGGETIDLYTENTPPPFPIYLYYNVLGYRFEESSFAYLPVAMESGNVPYGERKASITVSFRYNIKWAWDDANQTVVLTGFTEGFKPLTGYLNKSMFPLYKNLEEARAAGKPERIQIVMQENDPSLGMITYRYTLRAAWLTEALCCILVKDYGVLY